MVVLYGALCLPAAGLTTYSLANFNAIAVLYTLFNIVGFLAQAWMNIFIPYTMHLAAPIENLSQQAKTAVVDFDQEDVEGRKLRVKRETEGLKISVWGGNAMNSGTLIFYLITIGISYASYSASLYAGLYMTTGAGGVCVLLALAGWRFLPSPRGKPFATEDSFWMLPLRTCESSNRGPR
jgi:hypothetical protein